LTGYGNTDRKSTALLTNPSASAGEKKDKGGGFDNCPKTAGLFQ